MSESKPAEGLDLEQETTTPVAGVGALLDDTATTTAASVGAEAESVDFEDDEIYRRPGELAVCSEKTPGIKHRFTVLPDPNDPNKAFLRRSWTHYVQGKGHARCLSTRDHKGNFIGEPAFCCKGPEGASNPRLGALVVEYTCVDPKTGKFPAGIGSPEVPFTFEIKALCMTRIGAKSLSDKAGEQEAADGSVVGIPLKVSQVDYYYHARPGGQKGLDFERLSPKASYTRVPTLLPQVKELAAKYADGKELARKMSRVMNPNQMREHLGIGGSTATPGGADAGFQDL
jgi:hypothetical protein